MYMCKKSSRKILTNCKLLALPWGVLNHGKKGTHGLWNHRPPAAAEGSACSVIGPFRAESGG